MRLIWPEISSLHVPSCKGAAHSLQVILGSSFRALSLVLALSCIMGVECQQYIKLAGEARRAAQAPVHNVHACTLSSASASGICMSWW